MYFNYLSNKIYYEKIGSSDKVLIILPGWGDNRKTFTSIIKKLKDKFTIYIFDYPGFGNSNIPKNDLTIYNYAEMVIAFMNKNKINNPHIIGHSFGGRVILVMNGYYNIKFQKIVLISSAGIKPKAKNKKNIKQCIYKLLKTIGKILPRKINTIYQNMLISIFGSSDYKSLTPELRKTFINIVNEDLTKYLENVDSNTLLIWGEDDIDTPIDDAIIMNKHIKNSALITIKKATHFCYLEYPSYVISIILSFFK